jgi:hypothetical protein
MAGKARRTVLYSSKGKKLYAVRDAGGKFKDIQQYSRAHAMDIKRGSSAEKKTEGKKATAKKTAKKTAAKRPAAKKATARKVAKKSAAKRPAARKVAKKTGAKKTARKTAKRS